LDALAKLDFNRLSQEGRVDYLLLRNQLERELARLDREVRTREETTRLLPFEPAIDKLDEARRQKQKTDPAAAIALLTWMKQQVDMVLDELEVGLKPRPGKKSLQPSVPAVNAAASAIKGLRSTLKEWFDFASADMKLAEQAGPAFRDADKALEGYASFLFDRVLGGKVRDNSGIAGQPIGREALIQEITFEMIPYTPEELIEIAHREYAWCEAEMKKASRDLGFGNDWRKAVEKVKTLHVDPGKQPELIRDLAFEAIDYLQKHDLVTVPPVARDTWRMEMMSPQQQLVNPFFTGGETIRVSFPTNTMPLDARLQSMRGNNIHFSRATVHHELIPGHHLQGYMTARHHSHRRQFGTPFWTEGWALYWEMFLYDYGFLKSPEDRVGMLFWRMHRCARIVFSLNYHLGKMSPQECIDYLVERVGHERDNATAEVRRSFAGNYGPLYQAAYMLGGLQIRAMQKALIGPGKMTPREFHDAILQGGNFPIEMVRARITNQPLTRDFRSQWRFAE
jgi:uncharacterized protein (DUF885 family)